MKAHANNKRLQLPKFADPFSSFGNRLNALASFGRGLQFQLRQREKQLVTNIRHPISKKVSTLRNDYRVWTMLSLEVRPLAGIDAHAIGSGHQVMASLEVEVNSPFIS